MWRSIGIGVLLSLSWSTLTAQLTESDTLRFGYRANVNGSWITGNVERLLINSNLDLSHVGKTIGLKTSNAYIYGTIFKNVTENDIFSRNFIYLYPHKRVYPYAMFWLQSSKRQRIDFRYQAGLGLTYSLIANEVHQLKVSATVTREETTYDGTIFFIEPKHKVIDRVKNWRGTLRLLGHHRLTHNKVKFAYETWYQPAFDDANNWRYFLNAVLEIPLFHHVSFRTALLYSHESIVLENIKRDDKIVTFGLNISNF